MNIHNIISPIIQSIFTPHSTLPLLSRSKVQSTTMNIKIITIILSILHTFTQFTNSQSWKHPAEVNHNPDVSNGDVRWTELSPGVYHTTLEYVAASFDNASWNCPITTRTYNGTIPGPTLRMRPGNQYQVTLDNKLGPESDSNPDIDNGFKDPNTTNIHTHGLHISGEGFGDNVFTMISPNESHTYIWNIPCDHGGGMFFYHPHHHGSSALQFSSGSAGAIIIEESENELMHLPSWYYNKTEMPEILIIFQLFFPLLIDDQFDNKTDKLFSWGPPYLCDNEIWYTINGEYQPPLHIESGKWYKLRMVLVDPELPMSIYITNNETLTLTCELKLLARDGIPIHGDDNMLPRNVSYMWLGVAQRADVAIMCPGNSYGNATYLMGNQFRDILLEIFVSGTKTTPNYELNKFELTWRPSYIMDLRNYNTNELQLYNNGNGLIDPFYNLVLDIDSINGESFIANDSYSVAKLEINTINEWNIKSDKTLYGGYHPFHMHLYPFQVTQDGFYTDIIEDIPNDWHKVGDFVDILQGNGTIRFFADHIGGNLIVHCHIVYHADFGSMANFKVLGGCDENWNDIDLTFTYPQCQYFEDVTCATFNPSAAPTLPPSNSPTLSPSDLPTNVPSFSPSNAPSNNPTNIPSNAPSISPSNGPSSSPSQPPTDAPSFSPSNIPSNTPSQPPTYSPTLSPSGTPTNSPSQPPTNFPTINPVDSPTGSPSQPPTNYPSNNPTISPSNSPSQSPTKSPSNNPTISPSNSPSQPPTKAPSNSPSQPPTNSPSQPPTRGPTQPPTNVPSNYPSNAPSIVPTNVPSMSPSNFPSNEPTNSPSGSPSQPPTNAPSYSPSYSPSNTPSQPPTNVPSYLPSNVPSGSPSQPPTNAPSMLPSNEPTPFPTPNPTREQTPGECCHAREDTDRYELRCNLLDYTNWCESRYNQRRCEWDDSDPDNCATNKISTDNENCSCTASGGGRKTASCERNTDSSVCVFENCIWECNN